MLTQIAKIIISYENIIHFCYKLQKYTIQFVYLHQRNFETRRTAMKKSPADSFRGGLLYYIIYSVYIFGRESLVPRLRYHICRGHLL